MRYIRYVFLVAVGFCLLIVALANRGTVSIQVLPDQVADGLSRLLGAEMPTFQIALPMFVVVFVSIAVGLLIGFVWEWLREHKIRVDARHQKREKERLAREVKGMKAQATGGDDVLALLD